MATQEGRGHVPVLVSRNMEMSNTTTSSGGIGFCGLLAVLFIGLKLTGFITWSWWWVLAPVWIPAVIVLLVLGVAVIVVSMQ